MIYSWLDLNNGNGRVCATLTELKNQCTTGLRCLPAPTKLIQSLHHVIKSFRNLAMNHSFESDVLKSKMNMENIQDTVP